MTLESGQFEEPFKRFEFDGWEKCVAAYDGGFSQITDRVGEAMLEVLGVGPDCLFLDLASGPGHLSARADELGAQVTGVDFSPAMIACAKAHHPEVNYVQGDVESLNFADATFDAAAMNFGIPHLGNPEQAISEMARVVRKGGGVAFSAWASASDAQGFKIVLDAVGAKGDNSVSLPAGPSFFKYSDPDIARASMSAVGLTGFEFRTIPLRWRFASFDSFFRTFFEGTARTGGLLRAQPASALGSIRELVEESALKLFGSDDSCLDIPMVAKVYWAWK